MSDSDTISTRSAPTPGSNTPVMIGDVIIGKLVDGFKKLSTRDKKTFQERIAQNPSIQVPGDSSGATYVSAKATTDDEDPDKIKVLAEESITPPTLPARYVTEPTAPTLYPSINIASNVSTTTTTTTSTITAPATAAVKNENVDDKIPINNDIIKSLINLNEDVGTDISVILDLIQTVSNTQEELTEEIDLHKQRRKCSKKQLQFLQDLREKTLKQIAASKALEKLAKNPHNECTNLKELLREELEKAIDDETCHTLRNLGVPEMTKEVLNNITDPNPINHARDEDERHGGDGGDDPSSSSSSSSSDSSDDSSSEDSDDEDDEDKRERRRQKKQKKKEKRKKKKEKKKKKKKEKQERRRRRKEKHLNSDVPGDDDSLVSAASFFNNDPAQVLILKLKNARTQSRNTLKNYRDNQVMLEESRREIQQSIRYYEDKAPGMMSISPQNMEFVNDTVSDLHKDILEINLLLGEIKTSQDERRNKGRSKGPTFDGEAAEYLTFEADMDAWVRYDSAKDKMNNYKAGLVGSRRKEMTDLISNCVTYQEVKDAMYNRFGNFDVLLPAETTRLKNLPKFPRSVKQETDNINSMLKFYRLLNNRGKLQCFSSDLIVEMRERLREFNYEQLYSKRILQLSSFITEITQIQTINFEKLNKEAAEKGGIGGTHQKQPEQPGRINGRYGNIDQKPSCKFCSKTNHITRQCPDLANKSVLDIRTYLKRQRKCFQCLFPYDRDHKCTPTFIDKNNKLIYRVCQRCKSRLNGLICPCKHSSSGARAGPVAQRSSTVTAQETTPTTTPQVTGRAGNISFRSVKVDNVPIGSATCKKEILDMVDEYGNMKQVVLTYDCGLNTTLFNQHRDLQQFYTNAVPFTYSMTTIGHKDSLSGNRVNLRLHSNGEIFNIQGITRELEDDNVESRQVQIPQEWIDTYGLPELMDTPEGPTQILLGMDFIDYFPVPVASIGKLLLLQSKFTGNYIIAGYHPSMDTSPVNYVQGYSGRVSQLTSFNKPDQTWIDTMCAADYVVRPTLCDECQRRDCQKCKSELSKSPMTRFQESELRECLRFQWFDKAKMSGQVGEWRVRMKYNDLAKELPTYKTLTKNLILKLEMDLLNKPDHRQQFNDAMKEKFDSGMFAWGKDVDDPKFKDAQESFQSLQYVLKPGSTSSCRPVINGSLKTKGKVSLNDCQLVGSSGNAPILIVILKLRQWPFIFQTDLMKMYNVLQLDSETQAMNKFWFKRGGLGSDDHFEEAHCTVQMFGYSPAQFLSVEARNQTANMFVREMNHKAADTVSSSYTDDILGGDRTLQACKEQEEPIRDGMMKGGFKCKPFIYSLDQTEEELTMASPPASQGALGYRWTPANDNWKWNIDVNISKKKKGVRSPHQQINTKADIRVIFEKFGFNKKKALRLSHLLYCPLQLLAQVKLNFSILYRDLITKHPDFNWETEIPMEEWSQWEKAITMLLELKDLSIPRYGYPGYMEGGDVGLCCFVDGSGSASVAKLYARYETAPGVFKANLLMCAVKLAPPGPNAASKTETVSLKLGLELMTLVKETHTDMHFTSFSLFSDSTVALSGVCSLSAQQKLFYSERNHASQQMILRLNAALYFTESSENEADAISKLNLDKNHALSPEYWTSKWLHLDKDQWKCKRYDFDPDHCRDILNPKMVVRGRAGTLMENIFMELLQTRRRFSSVANILAVILKWKKNVPDAVTAHKQARLMLLQHSKVTEKELSGARRQYYVFERNGLTMANTRPYIIDTKTVVDDLTVLSSRDPIAQSLLLDLHIHCASESYQVAKMLQQGYLIIGARSWFKSHNKKCGVCRRIRKESVQALIGASHQLNAQMHLPPFSCVFIDVAGPFKLKVSRNIVKKTYVLLLSCIWSRFTILQLLEDVTASSILTAIMTASSQLGGSTPHLIYCDAASNFLPIRKIEDDASDKKDAPDDTAVWDRQIKDFRLALNRNKIKLIVSSPSSSWRQGLVESQVHRVKEHMERLGFKHKTYRLTEWNFIFSRIQNLLNNKPLNLTTAGSDLFVLTPNHLIFGKRNNVITDFPELIDNISDLQLYQKHLQLEQDIKKFNDLWLQTYGSTLKKWTTFKTDSKKLSIGSVCFILDLPNKETKYPRLGKVVDVLSDRTFKLEYVTRTAKIDPVSYKIIKSAKLTTIIRPAQQLCYITSDTAVETPLDPFIPPHTIPQPPDVPADISDHQDVPHDVIPAHQPVPDDVHAHQPVPDAINKDDPLVSVDPAPVTVSFFGDPEPVSTITDKARKRGRKPKNRQ